MPEIDVVVAVLAEMVEFAEAVETAVKFAVVDIVVERFAVVMAAAVAVELVAALKSPIDVPVMDRLENVHYRPDYPDVVSMTATQLVNHLAAVAAEQKVAYRFAGSMMQQFVLDSLGLVLAPTNAVAVMAVEI